MPRVACALWSVAGIPQHGGLVVYQYGILWGGLRIQSEISAMMHVTWEFQAGHLEPLAGRVLMCTDIQ